jgi:CrcB protein
MRRYWLVAIGGGIGTLMRFGISEWINGMGLWNPLAILIINVSGCFLVSFLNFISAARAAAGAQWTDVAVGRKAKYSVAVTRRT